MPASHSKKLSTDEQQVLKLAFAQPQQSHWKRNLLLGGLAAGGLTAGAYGLGALKPESILGGFTRGVNKNIVDPLIDRFRPQAAPAAAAPTEAATPPPTPVPTPTPVTLPPPAVGHIPGGHPLSPNAVQACHDRVLNEYDYKNIIRDALDRSGERGADRNAIPLKSQLDNPTWADGPAILGGLGMAGSLGMKSTEWAASKIPGLTPASKLLGSSAGLLSKAAPGLQMAALAPTALQLGDKYVGTYGQNWSPLMQDANKYGVAGLMMAAPVVGGLPGFLAPYTVNSMLNRYNENIVMQGASDERIAAAKKLFLVASEQAKHTGNSDPVRGWYGAQSANEFLRNNSEFSPFMQNMVKQQMTRQGLTNPLPSAVEPNSSEDTWGWWRAPQGPGPSPYAHSQYTPQQLARQGLLLH